MSATIDSLPEALLGRILGLCGLRAGRNITLVTKRWHAAFYAERSLWRRLSINLPLFLAERLGRQRTSAQEQQAAPLWCDSMQRRLRRVGGMVEEACVFWDQHATDEQLARLLQLLKPGTLQRLSLQRCDMPTEEPLPPAAPLQRFPGLHSLHLHCSQRPLPLLAAEAIGSMQQLSWLALETSRLPLAVVHAVAQLTQLTDLELTFDEIVPAASAGLLCLGRHSQLVYWTVRNDWHNKHGGPAVLVPLPACFSHLYWYELRNCQVEGMEAVQRLNCSSFQLGDGAPHELTLSEVTIGGALGPLLDALLRPDCRLGSLELFECEFDPEAPCPRLAPLTQLELTACRCHGSAAWVPELAWQTPALLSLTIDNTISDGDGQETYNWDDEEEVDLEAVAHLTLLTRLKLCALQMGSLPPGPYLQGLEEADLSRNSFWEVPRVLTAATSLRSLDLTECPSLHLAEAEVHEVLLHLPRLARLSLGGRPRFAKALI